MTIDIDGKEVGVTAATEQIEQPTAEELETAAELRRARATRVGRAFITAALVADRHPGCNKAFLARHTTRPGKPVQYGYLGIDRMGEGRYGVVVGMPGEPLFDVSRNAETQQREYRIFLSETAGRKFLDAITALGYRLDGDEDRYELVVPEGATAKFGPYALA